MKIVCRMSSVPLTMFKTIVYIKKGAPFSLLLDMAHEDFDWHQLTASAHAKACSDKIRFILIYYVKTKKRNALLFESPAIFLPPSPLSSLHDTIFWRYLKSGLLRACFCLWCTSEDFNIYLIIPSFMTNHSLHPYNPLFISHAFCAPWCGT